MKEDKEETDKVWTLSPENYVTLDKEHNTCIVHVFRK